MCCFRYILMSNELQWACWMLELYVCLLPLYDWIIMHMCMLVCLAFLLCLSFFNFSIDVFCLCSWGCLPGYCGVGRILFVGLRDGDVTEWYQSKGCNSGPLWAMKDAVTEAGCLLPSSNQEIDGSEWMEKFQNFLRIWTVVHRSPKSKRLPLWRKD